jgi:hypothetical protein
MKKNDAEPITKMPRRRYGFGPPRLGLGGAPGAVDIMVEFFGVLLGVREGGSSLRRCIWLMMQW